MGCYSLTIYICTFNLKSFVPFSETVPQLLDENQRYLSQLTSLLQDTAQDMEHSVMVWHTGMRECVGACK